MLYCQETATTAIIDEEKQSLDPIAAALRHFNLVRTSLTMTE